MLCGAQKPRLRSINTSVEHFGIDSRGSVSDSGRRVALFPSKWMAWCIEPASHQQTVSAYLIPVSISD